MPINIITKKFCGVESYFKFCFVRNPYDYAVSDYLWRTRMLDKNSISFKDYLNIKLENQFHQLKPEPVINWEIYTINDNIAVDFIGKFENLESDLKELFSILKLQNSKINLNFFFKKNFKRKNYKDYYDKETKVMVEKLHYKEIEYFKYKFD